MANPTVWQWWSDTRAFLNERRQLKDNSEFAKIAEPILELRNRVLLEESRPKKSSAITASDWVTEIRNKTTGHGIAGTGLFGEFSGPLQDLALWLMRETPLWQAEFLVGVPGNRRTENRILRGLDPHDSRGSIQIDVSSSGCALNGIEWSLPSYVHVDIGDNNTYFPNGSWRESDSSLELLCFSIASQDGTQGRKRVACPEYAELPAREATAPSETQSFGRFREDTHVLNNLPRKPKNYVARNTLESELVPILRQTQKRHLVSVRGHGGIGKTSVVLKAAHDLADDPDSPYEQIIWVSARDVDLLTSGPKQVEKEAEDLKGIYDLYGRLWGEEGNLREFFEQSLTDAHSATLLILDNFETFKAQEESYRYLDELVEPPSKVVITSRHDFQGDFQIPVLGMDRTEAERLVRSTAREVGREGVLSEKTIDAIFEQCAGHPYAMKMAATLVSRNEPASQAVSRVLKDEELLDALFRESADTLSESGQFVFLLVGHFTKGISLSGLELVGDAEGIAIDESLREVRGVSLAEWVDGQERVRMPAMAQEFARKLTSGHPASQAVAGWCKYLKRWPELVDGDVRSVVQRMAGDVADGRYTVDGRNTIDELESLAKRDGVAWRWLALALRAKGSDESRISRVYKRAVEECPDDSALRIEWSEFTSDFEHKADLRVQAVALDPLNVGLASEEAARLLTIRATGRWKYNRERWEDLKRPIVEVLWNGRPVLSSKDCSRLAWLCLQGPSADDRMKAKQAVELGLEIDPTASELNKLRGRVGLRSCA